MRIICTIVFSIFCAFTLSVKAQNIQFDRMYDEYGGWEIALRTVELDNANILTIDQTEDFFASDSTYYRRMYFSVLDSNGNKIKSNILSYKDQIFSGVREIIPRDDHFFAVCSYQSADTTLQGKGYYAKGVHFTAEGDTLSSVTINYHYIPGGKPGFGVPYTLSDRRFLTIAGYNQFYGDSMYIFWNDSLGNIIRVKEYPQLHMDVSKVIETPDKGFLLIGNQFEDERYKMVDLQFLYIGHPERLWYAKIDSMGTLKWQHLLTGDGYELYDTSKYQRRINNSTRFRDAIQTVDGNYVLAGYIENNPYLLKVNTQGEKLWEHKYYKNLHYLDTLRRRAMFADIMEKDGYLYVLGYYDTVLPQTTLPQRADFLMKLSSTGKTMWTRYILTEQNDYLYSLFPCKGGFMLTGSRHDTIQKYGSQDARLIKLDSNGCLFPGCNLNDNNDTLTFIPRVNQQDSKLVNIFPNPSSGIFRVESAYKEDVIATVWNINGQVVYKGKPENGTIDLSNQPQGLYVAHLTDTSGKVVAVKKLSVLR